MTSSDKEARERAMWAGLAAWEATGEVMPDVVEARAKNLRLEDYMDAVTRAARASIDGIDTEPVFVLLSDIPDEPAPSPDVAGLLYAKRINSVYGSHTAGKTWFSLWCANESEQPTLYIDYEDSASGFKARTSAMDEKLSKKVVHHRPTGPINVTSVLAAIERFGVGLVVIDSVGEAMASMGLDSNAEKDTTRWMAEVADAIADAGPAVLLVDHIAKKNEGTPTQVGSFRKAAAITGASFVLENKVGFSREKAGQSILTCTKDRNGTFATGEVVAKVDFLPTDGALEVVVARDAQADDAITEAAREDMRLAVMAEVRRWEDEEVPGPRGAALGASLSTIRRYLKDTYTRNDNVKSDREVRWLVEHGYLTEETRGQGHFHRVAKPYMPEFEAE